MRETQLESGLHFYPPFNDLILVDKQKEMFSISRLRNIHVRTNLGMPGIRGNEEVCGQVVNGFAEETLEVLGRVQSLPSMWSIWLDITFLTWLLLLPSTAKTM
jgi:hypothetical protein